MKKEKYSGSGKGAPKHADKHSSKGFGPSEASKNKAGGSNHKQISGTAEMINSAPSSARHKSVKGPNEMKDSKGSPGEKAKHMSEHVKGDLHGYLGKHGAQEALKKGHSSLGKAEDVLKHESNEQKDGVKKPKVSKGQR